MKITGSGYEIAKYVEGAAAKHANETTGKAAKTPDVAAEPRESTIVDLSDRAKEIQIAEEAMRSEPDIRTEKVDEIRGRVENGTYEIDYEKTAEKMLSVFLDEIV
ncbi:MAG: flagellar biosynthesis anti-sigma factor FlgM [Deltaproteobacteria bacterium]|nr:flagellar biosynthesis anti-sigma factor FlgM [Deltaproteobacteria bacterium]